MLHASLESASLVRPQELMVEAAHQGQMPSQGHLLWDPA